MRNAWLEETQAGIKIAGRNIDNLRYANNTTLMAKSEEKLKSLLMKVKEKSQNLSSSSTSEIKVHGFCSRHPMAIKWRNGGNSGRRF